MLYADDTPPSATSFSDVLYYAFLVGLVIGPHIGYVVQYIEIAQRHNADGYAALVSLILLTSNTLRVYYYLGRRFALALLLQAVLAVVVHIALTLKVLQVTQSATVPAAYDTPRGTSRRRQRREQRSGHGNNDDDDNDEEDEEEDEEDGGNGGGVVVAGGVHTAASATRTAATGVTVDDVNSSNGNAAAAAVVATSAHRGSLYARRARPLALLFECEDVLERHLLAHTPVSFISMYIFVALLALIAALAYYGVALSRWSAAPEAIGYVALGIESLLLVPQILRNARRHSVDGLTLVLVLTWLGGDVVKLIYFICAHQPPPFVVSCVVQLVFDCVVVTQVAYYRFGLCNSRGRRRGGGGGGGAGIDDDHTHTAATARRVTTSGRRSSRRRDGVDVVVTAHSDGDEHDGGSHDTSHTHYHQQRNGVAASATTVAASAATTTASPMRAAYGAADRHYERHVQPLPPKTATTAAKATTSPLTRATRRDSVTRVQRVVVGEDTTCYSDCSNGDGDDPIGTGSRGHLGGNSNNNKSNNSNSSSSSRNGSEPRAFVRPKHVDVAEAMTTATAVHSVQQQPQGRNDGYESGDSLRYLTS